MMISGLVRRYRPGLGVCPRRARTGEARGSLTTASYVSLHLFDDYDHSTYLRRCVHRHRGRVLYDSRNGRCLLSSPSASPSAHRIGGADRQFWWRSPWRTPASDRWPFKPDDFADRRRPPTGSGWSRTTPAGVLPGRAVRPPGAGSATNRDALDGSQWGLCRFLFGVFLSEPDDLPPSPRSAGVTWPIVTIPR